MNPANIEMVRYLLDRGIDINTQDEVINFIVIIIMIIITLTTAIIVYDQLGYSALHEAARYGCKHITLLLLQRGAKINLQSMVITDHSMQMQMQY